MQDARMADVVSVICPVKPTNCNNTEPMECEL